MKKCLLRLMALVLACTLLTGCSFDLNDSIASVQEAIGGSIDSDRTAYADMVYTRPDVDAMAQLLEGAKSAATEGDLPRIVVKVNALYDAYDRFYTDYSLADIRYSGDLTDSYWEAEYSFCLEKAPQVEAMLEELYYALAKSPCVDTLEGEEYFGEGFFDSYQGENNWDAEFTALLEQESALISRYYELAARGAEFELGSEAYYEVCYAEMAQVLVELILLRQDIAAYWGCDSYSHFATDFYHYRDYTVEESRAYLDQIRQQFVDLYCRVNRSGIWETGFSFASEQDIYGYVERTAKNMGGIVAEAFTVMDQCGLYDIGYSENKYASSFEVYLTSYAEPFIFLCPDMSTYDQLVFAHEFGHFCTDYAAWGSYAGVDVLEIFSQGMEYLSLCYTGDSAQLTKMKMADSLCMYVEQAAYAAFEMAMYDLPPEEVSPERLYALYKEVGDAYGFESIGYDPREFVTVNHYYTNPMYIMSYVVSNDAALQLYQLEQETPGAGLRLFEENLATEEYYFLAFLESAGLESPFAEGRLQRVRQTLEAVLGSA